jgi:hypothetical protein
LNKVNCPSLTPRPIALCSRRIAALHGVYL